MVSGGPAACGANATREAAGLISTEKRGTNKAGKKATLNAFVASSGSWLRWL